VFFQARSTSAQGSITVSMEGAEETRENPGGKSEAVIDISYSQG